MAAHATPSPLLSLWGGPKDPRKGQVYKRGFQQSWGSHPYPLLTCPWQADFSLRRFGWTTSCAWPSRVGDVEAWRGGIRTLGSPPGGSASGAAGRLVPGQGGEPWGGGIASTPFTPPRPSCEGGKILQGRTNQRASCAQWARPLWSASLVGRLERGGAGSESSASSTARISAGARS